jgi:steroid delta-isomerase-like uncharacterized protein
MKKSSIQFILILPLALVLCFAFGCQQQGQEGITEEEVTSISERSMKVWNEGSLDIIDELCAPGYVRHYVDVYEDIVGIEAYKKWVTDTRTSFPDFTIAIEERVFTNDKIVVRVTATGTNTGPLMTPMGELPPTGKKIRFRLADIIQVVDGKITEEWIYYNQTPVLLQLGFTLVPPQPPEEVK